MRWWQDCSRAAGLTEHVIHTRRTMVCHKAGNRRHVGHFSQSSGTCISDRRLLKQQRNMGIGCKWVAAQALLLFNCIEFSLYGFRAGIRVDDGFDFGNLFASTCLFCAELCYCCWSKCLVEQMSKGCLSLNAQNHCGIKDQGEFWRWYSKGWK